eukprot:g9485.t1
MEQFYAVLRPEASSMDGLRRAFRKQALKSHPDKPGGSEEDFKNLVKAAERIERELNGEEEPPGSDDAGAGRGPAPANRFSSSGPFSSAGLSSTRASTGSWSASRCTYAPKRRKEDWASLGSENWVSSAGPAGSRRDDQTFNTNRARVRGMPVFEDPDADNSEEEVDDYRSGIRLGDLQLRPKVVHKKPEVWVVDRGGGESSSSCESVVVVGDDGVGGDAAAGRLRKSGGTVGAVGAGILGLVTSRLPTRTSSSSGTGAADAGNGKAPDTNERTNKIVYKVDAAKTAGVEKKENADSTKKKTTIKTCMQRCTIS